MEREGVLEEYPNFNAQPRQSPLPRRVMPYSDATDLLSGDKDARSEQNDTLQTEARASIKGAAGRPQHERAFPALRISDSMAMCNDMLTSNDLFSKVDDLVVERRSRTLGPALLRRSILDPNQNAALRSPMKRNRYPERWAEYGAPFYSLPRVTNCWLR